MSTAAASRRTPVARAKQGWGCPCRRAPPAREVPRRCVSVPLYEHGVPDGLFLVAAGTCRGIYRGLFKPLRANSGNRRLAWCCFFLPVSGRAGRGIARPGTRGDPGAAMAGRSERWGATFWGWFQPGVRGEGPGTPPLPCPVRDAEGDRRARRDWFAPHALSQLFPVNFWLLVGR